MTDVTHGAAGAGAPPPGSGTEAAPALAPDPFGPLLAPLTLRTAGERIAERFVTAIALGEFVPGQALPSERELAAMLEVSRTTVREALQRLHAAGYVTTRRGRGGGTFVQTGVGPQSDDMIRRTLLPAWEELSEILDFRQLIEQQIARTAAERRDARDIEVIRAAVSGSPAMIASASSGCWCMARRRTSGEYGSASNPKLTSRRIRSLSSVSRLLWAARAMARCTVMSADRDAPRSAALA